MRSISNSTITTLLRCLPLILDNLNEEAMRRSTRLYNAVRQTKIIINKLKRIEYEQRNNEHKA